VFTGITLGLGHITSRRNKGSESLLTIESSFDWESPLVIGESIAVSGVCLTVTEAVGARAFKTFASSETMSLTTLGTQNEVNLERALRLSDRLGGHLVSGHVDSLTTLIGKTKAGTSLKCLFSLPQELSPLVVPKGSVAIDGISLTVNIVNADSFSVNIIPHTASLTTISSKNRGSQCNLEVDILGRYIKRLLETPANLASPNPAIITESSNQDQVNKKASAKSSNSGPGLTIEELIAQGF
jgi:riboflavin synthase